MLLKPGDSLLIVHRRLFERDKSRYFLGTLEEYESGLARVTGNTWVQNTFDGHFVKKEDARTKIISLSSGGVIVYLLPDGVDIRAVHFALDKSARLIVHDGKKWKMDLSESLPPND